MVRKPCCATLLSKLSALWQMRHHGGVLYICILAGVVTTFWNFYHLSDILMTFLPVLAIMMGQGNLYVQSVSFWRDSRKMQIHRSCSTAIVLLLPLMPKLVVRITEDGSSFGTSQKSHRLLSACAHHRSLQEVIQILKLFPSITFILHLPCILSRLVLIFLFRFSIFLFCKTFYCKNCPLG